MRNNKLVIIGLDGMSVSQAKYVAKKFALPNLEFIVENKGCISIESEIPELSPVNWTSFFTGHGPETHGVFGFVNLDPNTYTLGISDFTRVKCKTIFDELGSYDIISRVINLPNTYPAPSIRGILISGFVALDLALSVYPREYLPYLKKIKYCLEADTSKGIKDPEYLFNEVKKTLHSRKRVLDFLWRDLAWDLFIIIFTETDRINHFFYPAIFDEKNHLHPLCMSFFKELDKVLGDILERFYGLPFPKRLMVVSDHGFCEVITEVDINVLLRQAGILVFEKRPRSEFDASIISKDSKAFALDPGRIYVHKKGLFSKGSVDKKDYKKVVEDVISCVKDLEYNGKKVFKKFFLKEEIYPGAEFEDTPDIVLIPNRGFDLKAKFDRDNIFGIYGRFGTHFGEDVLFFDSLNGSNVKKVRDIGQEILKHFIAKKEIITI